MEHQINEEIRDKEVRLISDDGEQLGIVPIQQAQDLSLIHILILPEKAVACHQAGLEITQPAVADRKKGAFFARCV